MKIISSLFFLLAVFSTATAQEKNIAYDKALADSLGADEYGMKKYIFVILKTGSSNISDKKVLDSLFAGHMKNIGHLAAINKLIVAGPMKKNDKTYRGIFILDVKTVEEAKALLELDPTIKQKVLEVEMFEWYGSAALPKYLKYHDIITKTKM